MNRYQVMDTPITEATDQAMDTDQPAEIPFWKQDIARGVLKYDIHVFITAEKDMSEEKMKEMESLICMTQEEIRAYIEAQFTDGMSWENVEIGYIVPIIYFNVIDLEEKRKCSHYTNLQPLLPSYMVSSIGAKKFEIGSGLETVGLTNQWMRQ